MAQNATFMDTINDMVDQFIKEHNRPLGFLESIEAFFYAVNWSERWLWALGAFHFVVLVAVVLGRNKWKVQAALLAATCEHHPVCISCA